jgi:Glutathione S-transferase, C-terminal domain
MIEFHAGNGPDTQAVGIALEEMFFDYRVMPGRAPLPVIAIGGARVAGAPNIVMALARKAGRFLVAPEDAAPWLATPAPLDALEAQLGAREFVLGAFSVADMAVYPHAVRLDAARHPAIARWIARMSRRSGVGRGMGVIVR